MHKTHKANAISFPTSMDATFFHERCAPWRQVVLAVLRHPLKVGPELNCPVSPASTSESLQT